MKMAVSLNKGKEFFQSFQPNAYTSPKGNKKAGIATIDLNVVALRKRSLK